MTQLIADVLKRDEEEKRLRRAADIPGVRGLFEPYCDDATRSVYDAAADALAGRAAAVMRGDPFAAWVGTPTGPGTVELAMPAPTWDDAEYSAAARYRAP